MEPIARDALAPALLAWAYVTGAAEPLAETLPASLGWLRACWEAGHAQLPLFAVHDLGLILLRGREFRFASTRDLGRWPEPERAGRLAWEDRVLGRWALDPTVTEAHVAVAGMRPAQRDLAVAHAVELALSRALAGVDDLARGNAGYLRAAAPLALKRAPARFEDWPSALTPEWMEWAAAQRDAVTAGLAPGRLFRPEDLWEISHLPDLPSDSARLALREVHAVAASVGPVSPAVALSIRTRAREVPVDAEEADQYPAGGFDAVATRGAFENLVRTEVVYVGEGAEDRGGIDLFDVRFAENELLFYTRDESPLFDARRDVTVAFDRPADQRIKQPAHPAQALVMAEALALAVQADLLRVFGPSGSRVRLAWRAVSAEDRAAAEEERALLALTLAAEVSHRRVELSVVSRWDELPEGSLVVLSPRAPEAGVACAAWIRTGERAWELGDARYAMTDAGADLRALADRVLAAVTRRVSTRKGSW